MRRRVEALIDAEESNCREKIAPHRGRLEGKRAVLFTGGVKTWSMVNALRELGVEILAAGTQNSTLDDFHRMKSLMHEDARIIEDTSTAGLLGVMREKMPDLIVADYRLRDGQTGIEAIEIIRSSLGVPVPAILVSGDNDFSDALQAVKELGKHVEVALFGSGRSSQQLRAEADKVLVIDAAFLAKCWRSK